MHTQQTPWHDGAEMTIIIINVIIYLSKSINQ